MSENRTPILSTVAVSDKARAVIPAASRRGLGIGPEAKLDFELEGDSVRVRLRKAIPSWRAEDGSGSLRCDLPGETGGTDER
ncbi:hypothetical protein CKO41_10385 [Thiococcus pfennigii]|nr:AbrB/MazE/SpoVT family DNA-binding domain-containing protein [Thiococcus pfennigii]MBK1732188.1 hypothetical protein [Thiococcus pfennigii]